VGSQESLAFWLRNNFFHEHVLCLENCAVQQIARFD